MGMQTFDAALFDLVLEGVVSEEEALKNADAPNNLRLRIKLHGDTSGGPTGTGLSLVTEAPPEEKKG